jgi:hypothetical protein
MLNYGIRKCISQCNKYQNLKHFQQVHFPGTGFCKMHSDVTYTPTSDVMRLLVVLQEFPQIHSVLIFFVQHSN